MLTLVLIAALAVANIITTTAVIILWRKVRSSRSLAPSEYIDAINQKHTDYITAVTEHMNHTHGVGLMVDDVRDSALFFYTTSAMINDIPVEKCANAIVWVLDDLIRQQAENTEGE